MWQSLWANIDDEIARARGHGSSNGFFGLPAIEVEDLTGKAAAATPPVNGRQSLHQSPPCRFDKWRPRLAKHSRQFNKT
jgi:hypothetical protein